MLNYLYYKLYRAILKGSLHDIPEFISPVFLGGLLGINIIVISAFFAKINLIPFILSNAKQGGYLTVVLIILAMGYYNEDKREALLKKYSIETNKQRIKGNIIVSIYIGLLFILIFAVAFFKPKYLP